MGSNKLLQVALGRSESDEVRSNIHQLAERIKGQVGLLFTQLSKEDVSDWLAVMSGSCKA